MLKKLFKKLLPRVVLNAAHRQVNQLRIATVDKLLFPERVFKPQEFIIRRDAYPFAGVVIATKALEARLQQQIAIWQEWTQDEYLLVYNEPCLIEPRAGWALTANNRLIYPSLGFSRADYLRKPALAALRMRDKPAEEYAELISLRDTGEENYYHFYNDVLTKLFFLEEKLGVGADVPILIAATLYKRAYFQYFRQHPYLRDRTWVVQDEQYVRSRKTYFCKPLTHTISYYGRIRELAPPADVARTGAERRIFITRSPKRLRYIENGAEIEQLCRAAGLEVLDFDELTLAEQIHTLANARYVVGIHGAGLVNMLFRGGRPMSLLEIFPPGDYYPFHYMLMAAQLGFAYDGLVGKASPQRFSAGFYVPPQELQTRLQTMLTAGQQRIAL
ncbi:glycosyltransferase family 61 protein [Hymenobacter sp. RP-2-7]|uniref:Glycosyltransferase family 61 protein n=1 Tax=Hymenobacter polaris TaxID=2682546 RepID=A0A7Y0FPI8_9BACT|nr:glycosyltransferase family 61 protein [Hymenobacter polaris]NML68068.1 glycosyltransferase family 61 protein [Hymenobacter polaris]